MPYEKLSAHLYLVGDSHLSHPLDCNVYLVDGSPTECLLVDSGGGLGVEAILRNIGDIGLDLGLVSAVVNTHCHYRHAGGNRGLNRHLGYCEVIVHELDARAVETGDSALTGAGYYGQLFEPCEVNVQAYTTDTEPIKSAGLGTRLTISAGEIEFSVTDTPGHTPGSMSLYGELDGARVLFAGDIESPPRVDRGSDTETWLKTIDHLLKLDVDRIYAGHRIVVTEPQRWLESLLG